ncbi:uncharacterized protein LOC141856757 isoform X2 [Brevipalpus obovatus]|uniref:uncharacterized protein LOC141856757 isoform X2 n=1 Tax=Brevipalpus obovatus TaxID=246614 RepID=UPI003D9E9609
MYHILLSVTLFSVLFQVNGIRLTGTDLKNICVQAKRFIASGYSPIDAVEKISSRIEKTFQDKFFRSGKEGRFSMSPSDELMIRAAVGAFVGETERAADDPSQYGAAKLSMRGNFKQKDNNYILFSQVGAFDQSSATTSDGIKVINIANRIKGSKAKAVVLDTQNSNIPEDSISRYVNDMFQKDKEGFPIRNASGSYADDSDDSDNSDEPKSAPSSPVQPSIHINPTTNSVTDPAECYAIHYPDQIETEDQIKWATFIENLVNQMTGRHLTGR